MPINNIKWTVEGEDLLRQHYKNGLSCSQIAFAINSELRTAFSRNAVIGKIHRLGLDGRPRPASGPRPRPRAEGSRRYRQDLNRIQEKRAKIRIQYAQPIIEVTEIIEAPTVDDLAIPIEQRKTLLELNENTCRWPVGDPQASDFFFCGAAPKAGSPYCSCHHRIAYHAPVVRQRGRGQQNRSDAIRHWREEEAA